MKKSILAIIVALTAAVSASADVVEAIVIRVGDRIVTQTQYKKRMADAMADVEQNTAPENVAARKAEVRKTLIDDLVSELLLKDRADRLGITVSEGEIKEAVNRLKQQYNISTDEQFEQSLKNSNMTRADMEARLRDTLVTNKVFARELRSREEATDAELRERYNREKERYRLPERAHLREIVVLKPEDALKVDEARRRANDAAAATRLPNADFGKLASTLSESGTRDKNGDLGEVSRGDLVPELDRAVFNATPGTVLGPIETKSAFHIVKVEQRLPSEVPAFESIKDRLRKEQSEETFQRDYKAYIENLRKDAFVQINDQNLPKV
ncbi:MAG TPA: peptidyl-prolyl cis-trans isomerase [Thermoanaerobaculia bacterium]|nr:peptidyl-prolyl cis-trans isomerase [Thermoanaerobaculia bacterium]